MVEEISEDVAAVQILLRCRWMPFSCELLYIAYSVLDENIDPVII